MLYSLRHKCFFAESNSRWRSQRLCGHAGISVPRSTKEKTDSCWGCNEWKGQKQKTTFCLSWFPLLLLSYKYIKKTKWGQKNIYGYEAKCCIFVFCHQTEDYCYKKNNLCPKLVVLNMILFKLEACHFSKLISTQNWTVLGPITLIIFFSLYQNVKKQINSQSSFLNLFLIPSL